MARTTISVPDDLKSDMDKHGAEANWSAVAAEAFRVELHRLKARKATREGKKMQATIDRLRASKKAFVEQAEERGYQAGARWAREDADYAELNSLKDSVLTAGGTDTTDALGPPGVFMGAIRGREGRDRAKIISFWEEHVADGDDDDRYSAPFWDGFIEGALAVFEEVEGEL